MKKIIFAFGLSVLFIACKTSNPTASAPKSSSKSKNTLTDAQRADVTYVFFNANKEKILGNLNNAADLFAEVIRKDGSNHAAMYELANIYVSQKKYADALFFIKTAHYLDPKNEWYALSYSDILQKNNKIEESVQVLDQLVKDYPDRVDFYFELASAQIMAGKMADAIKTMDKIEAQTGINKDVTMQKVRLYRQLGKNDKAIAEVQKLIDSNPKEVQSYNMLAELYQNLGQKDKALETYNKVLAMDPDNAYIHLSLADFYRSNGEKEKSIAELKKAFSNKNLDVESKVQILGSYYALVELHPELKDQAMEMCKLLIEAHPTDPRVYEVYGDFLGQDSLYEKARDEYRTAIKLGSKEFRVTHQVLVTDIRLTQWDTLEKESAEAMSLFPDQPRVYFYNGLAYMQMKKYPDAVKVLNQGVKMVVDDKQLENSFYGSLGDCYQEMKEYALSEQNYEKALAIDPKDATILNNYAYYLSVRGEKLDKAEEMSKQSIDLTKDTLASASYEDTYGWIMYKQGKYSEAKTWIEKSLIHSKEKSGTVLEHYGDILYKLGDLTKSYEYWQKAKTTGEGSEFLDKKLSEKKLVE